MAQQGIITVTVLVADGVGERGELERLVSSAGGTVAASDPSVLVVWFGSASTAVDAAAAIQEHGCSLHGAPSLRVGIAAGDVTPDHEGELAGSAVTAARDLHAIADRGQILTTLTVRLLTGGYEDERFERVGAIELGGSPQPVQAYSWARTPRVAGSDPARATPLLPLVLSMPQPHALVGRDRIMGTLRHAWRQAQDGAGCVVLIGGEAGTGKTRVATELSKELHRDGACVLHGGCDIDLALPYQPWVQATEHLLGVLPRAARIELEAHLAPVAHLLTGVPPVDERRRMSLDAGTEQYRSYRAFAAALTSACAQWPTLVVLDDLHWAGSQTLALLRHLARSGLPEHLLIVGTFRDTGDEVTEPLASCLADLRRTAGVTRLQLTGLGSSDVELFVSMMLEQPLDAGLRRLAAEMADRTGGNPFYLSELWQHLINGGHVAYVNNAWTARGDTASTAIPDSIREVTVDRLARLSDGARRSIEIGALSGEGIELDVLAEAADLSTEERANTIGELVDAGIIAPVTGANSYRFTHSLVRDAVAASNPPHRRTRHHLALAQAIEHLYDSDHRPVLAELAGHYAEAGGPVERIVHFGQQAAAQAVRAAAYDEAVAHLDVVLSHVTPATGRAALLVELAAAHLRRGAYDASRAACAEAFRIAVDMHDAARAVDAAVGFETAMHFPGLPGGPAVEMLQTALDMLGEHDTARRAEASASLGRALVFAGRTSDGIQVAESAVDLARRVGEPHLLATALQAAVTVNDDEPRMIDGARELARIAERLGDTWAAAYADANLLRAYIALGRLDEAAQVQEHHRTTSAAGHFSIFEFMVSAFDVVFALAAADFAGAEEAAERARSIGEAHAAPYDAGVYGLQMYAIRRAQGRLDEVAPVMRVLARHHDAANVWGPGLAALYSDVGMLAEARHVFDELAPDDFAVVQRDAVWPASLTFLAETCLALGERDRAPVLIEELRAFEGKNLMAGMTVCFGPADRLIGGLEALIGHDESTDAHFGAAVELAERCRSPLWTVETQYDWAVALTERDPARSAELAARAIADAKLLGVGRISSRVPLCARPAEKVTTGESHGSERPGGLSTREADVLRLIATGRSNREIGAELFISQNTVANHVQAILRKTSCANRTEASMHAVRHGLTD